MRRAFLFILVLVGCGIVPVAAQEPDHLVVSGLPYLSFAPLYIAAEEGYFAEQNIEVEFTAEFTEENALPGLLGGDLDVGVYFLSAALFNAISRGAEIQIVADKGYFAEDHCASSGFVARTDVLESGALDSADTLADLTFSVEMDTIENYLLEKAFMDSGVEVDLASLNTTDLPPPVMQESLINNAVQVGYASEPWVTRAANTDEAELWLSAEAIAPNMPVAVLVFGPKLLTENPELGERFMTAYLQGVAQYNEGATERNVEIVNLHTEIPVPVIESACWMAVSEDGVVQTEHIVTLQEWMFEHDLLDEVVPVEGFWNSHYVDFVNDASQ